MLVQPGRLDVQQSWAMFETAMVWLCVEVPHSLGLGQALHQGIPSPHICGAPEEYLKHEWFTFTKLAMASRQIPMLAPGHPA